VVFVIREVPSLNLGQETDYTEFSLNVSSSVPAGKCLKADHDHFLPHPPQYTTVILTYDVAKAV
jgi:hypothetical protein